MKKNATYKGPFEYDPWSQMITSPHNPCIIAQTEWPLAEGEDQGEGDMLLIRGWGGLHTTFGEAQGRLIQDAFGRRVAQLLNEHGMGDEVWKLIDLANSTNPKEPQ